MVFWSSFHVDAGERRAGVLRYVTFSFLSLQLSSTARSNRPGWESGWAVGLSICGGVDLGSLSIRIVLSLGHSMILHSIYHPSCLLFIHSHIRSEFTL